MGEDYEFDNKQKYSIKDKKAVFMRVMLGQLCCMVTETLALIEKLKDILKSCDRKKLRYMVRVRWQDR